MPHRNTEITRRDFVRTAAVAGSAVMLPGVHTAIAAPTPKSDAETTVGRFYATLSDAQKKTICFPFEHQLRRKISANWHVADALIGNDFYSDKQRELIQAIVRGVTSEDGYERFLRQMDEDDGGIDGYSVAIFGEPGGKHFEWELTGRHLTLRADGNTVDGVAFGGPIVYGHGESDPKQNLFHYQTRRANEVFKSLDEPQAKQALLKKAPRESAVQLQGAQGKFPGVAVSGLSADQQQLVKETLHTLLAPYREEDGREAIAMLEAGGGLDKLHMAFYQEGDLNDDRVWDVWRVEGPTWVSHFRGAPHVHAYMNIGVKKA